jgi:uncharacterized protein YjiS (DUF1127 family)
MEPAMTFTFTTRGSLRWYRVKQSFTEWQWRSRSRQELEGLSDATLRDIGVTRCDVHRETQKPFWMV